MHRVQEQLSELPAKTCLADVRIQAMREVDVAEIRAALKKACGTIAVHYSPDILKALKQGAQNETDERSRFAMDMLMDNAHIAENENIPICQDTGMAIVWVKAGQEVHFINGSLQEAIQQGVAEGYTEAYLRASVVSDPLFDRRNTGTNTPALIYTELVPGNEVTLELMAKGFGSENMSRIRMLKPAEGVEGVKQFVLETIRLAGPNACPPMIVGVGIGGTFDYAAELSKKALLRPLTESNPDPRYAELEKELLEEAQKLKIGPMGLHGNTTALKIQILEYPTHIAGLPCAVNICCHACRHTEIRL